ncbi:MAG: hypothetical protein EPO25_14295 [Gammaproteobacteria bacterium]|nr:MAG: hypothetical protein EPO25_14295 [Gammaproteobacteria bacterium]
MIQFLLGLPFSYRQKKLTAGRPSIGQEQFVSMISTDSADRSTAEKIWDALVACRIDNNFAPYPDDSLGRVYGIAEEELDQDLIARILKDLDLPIPDRDFTERFGVIDSPRRVAKFVSEWRQRVVADAFVGGVTLGDAG